MSILLLLGILLAIMGGVLYAVTKNLIALIVLVAGVIFIVVALFSDDTLDNNGAVGVGTNATLVS